MSLQDTKSLWAALSEVIGAANPKAADVKECLRLAGRTGRCLLDLPAPSAYRVQKKNAWQQDLAALFGLAFAAFQAHAAAHLQPLVDEAPEDSPLVSEEEPEEGAPEEDDLLAVLS